MAIPQQFIDQARAKMNEINAWFQQQVQANPSAVLSLVAQRGARIQSEIYATFTNARRQDYQAMRFDSPLHLSCYAGRGHPFGGVPEDDATGTVSRDATIYVNVPEENRVDVHNNIAGDHSVTVSPDRSSVTFNVHCRGVAWEDTTRGHGAYDATLHAIFKFKDQEADNRVAIERDELGHIIGA
jgi:hypothetical protein